MKFDLSFWTNASSKRKRIYSVIAIFLVAFIVTLIGSYIPLSSQDATTLSKQVNATLNEHKASNTLTEYIFLNNFSICLLMFLPLAGAAVGMFILFDTGVALNAIATTQGYPVWLGLASLIVTPVFWLEFASYSIAMAESIWLIRRLIQAGNSKVPQGGRSILWRELKWTLICIGTCAGLLAVGAVVEVWLINLAG
jgi:hypothetical protein